ncbi:hypothetical protein BCR36DRAFT_583105 [Piromyces finnis]|uniref:Uncharacterized protein n=1 Tax=Piromyces finnis TaxID=1754191 RepID=A0A1Y1VA38_9FUNG|nr:hypothetical protein BCR36DRAFT_583105 [Piromyces finnis]|eukprot:ORX51036.1 hypothetical protein BCR36DRAFT_583105 [Piromyces finnis]
MNVGYYSIDNTDTNCQLPTNDYPTTYNVIERFKSVLSNPKNVGKGTNVNWENNSNVVVDSNGNTYYLLKSNVNNASFLKIIIVDANGKLLAQQDINNEFKNIDNTQKNKVYLIGNSRVTMAILVNDGGKLYRYYYNIKSTKNNSVLEIDSFDEKSITRDSKENYYSINTNTIPLEPRLSIHGSTINALIKPLNDKNLNENYPYLMTIEINNNKITEKCTIVKNSEVFQYLPSLQTRNEKKEEDAYFDFGTDYDVFLGNVKDIVYDPPSMVYLGNSIKMQRFDWSSTDFYYANTNGIGLYHRKDPESSSILWKITGEELPKDYSSMTTDFVAYSKKEKHLFSCINEDDQGENGYVAIIDTNTKKVYENKTVACSKDSIVLVKDRSFISSTKDGINFYQYDKNFNIQKIKSIGVVAAGSSFISAPVIFNDRLYANGNVYCNDTLSKDIISKDIFGETNKIVQNAESAKMNDKDKFNYMPILIGIGVFVLLAILASLLFMVKKKKNRDQSIQSIHSSREEFKLSDEDFDIDLNVGIRNSNSRFSNVTLESKQSFSSKFTTQSNLSQKSLIIKTEHSNKTNEVRNADTTTNNNYTQLKDTSATMVDENSKNITSPAYTNESTLFGSEKLAAHKYVDGSLEEIVPPSEVLYKNSKAPLLSSKNQNVSNDAKAGLVQTKNIPKPYPQQIIVVNQMLTDSPSNEDEVNHELIDNEMDVKLEKNRKSIPYIAPFITKIKNRNSKNYDMIPDNKTHHINNTSSSSIFSNDTIKQLDKQARNDNTFPSDHKKENELLADKAIKEAPVINRISIRSNSTSSTVKNGVENDELPPLAEASFSSAKKDTSFEIPEFPENNIRNIYKKPLLGKQSKASLMSIDPLKIDSDTFKERPQFNELLFDEDAIPPPTPEFASKNLTNDNSSDFSFRTSKTKNTLNSSSTSTSNYSERLDDIKQKYRQFQNNLQNKYNNESDQTSYFSAASSVTSNPIDDMKMEEFDLENDPFFVPPLPKPNNVFRTPNCNGSKSSVKTGGTSYYSATSDMLDEKESTRKFNNVPTDFNFSNVERDNTSEVAHTSFSYNDPNNDNISINSFHSCVNPVTSPIKVENIISRSGSQFSSAGSSNFYSINSAQLTSQSLPSSANVVSPTMDNLSLGNPHSIMHSDSIKSTTTFQSAADDSFISRAASVGSQFTNPFLRNSYASEISRNDNEGISPLSQNIFNDTNSFISAAESFHTVKTSGKRNDYDSPVQNIFNDTSSMASAAESFHTVKTSGKRNDYDSPVQNIFNDTSSMASAAESFHTVKTSGKRNDYDSPIQNIFNDTSSMASAAESFYTIKTNNTQATDATTNTFKTAKPGYNPFKN